MIPPAAELVRRRLAGGSGTSFLSESRGPPALHDRSVVGKAPLAMVVFRRCTCGPTQITHLSGTVSAKPLLDIRCRLAQIEYFAASTLQRLSTSFLVKLRKPRQRVPRRTRVQSPSTNRPPCVTRRPQHRGERSFEMLRFAEIGV